MSSVGRAAVAPEVVPASALARIAASATLCPAATRARGTPHRTPAAASGGSARQSGRRVARAFTPSPRPLPLLPPWSPAPLLPTSCRRAPTWWARPRGPASRKSCRTPKSRPRELRVREGGGEGIEGCGGASEGWRHGPTTPVLSSSASGSGARSASRASSSSAPSSPFCPRTARGRTCRICGWRRRRSRRRGSARRLPGSARRSPRPTPSSSSRPDSTP